MKRQTNVSAYFFFKMTPKDHTDLPSKFQKPNAQFTHNQVPRDYKYFVLPGLTITQYFSGDTTLKIHTGSASDMSANFYSLRQKSKD